MKNKYLHVALLTVAATMTSQVASAQTLTSVDLELALLVDVSGSVDTTEFNLQRQGYVNAFNSASLQAAFAGGRTAAVTFIYWAGPGAQQQAVGWTLINSAASATAFAAAVGAAGRPFEGGTDPLSAINFVTPQFATNAFTSLRQIIDVSGDGEGSNSTSARDAALAAGIDQINGLPIGGGAALVNYYQTYIQGGVGSFTEPADSFSDFGAAVERKLGREIIAPGVPEPATWAMLVMGFGAVGCGMRRRRSPGVRVTYA